MALSAQLKKDNNDYKVDFKNVYYKIDDCFIDTLDEEVRIGVRGYADEYARQNNAIGIYKKVFTIKFSDLVVKSFSKNEILTSCYKYLSTLEEFKESKAI